MAIVLLVFFVIFLFLDTANPRGTVGNPYNSTLGYQGQGYYSYQGAKLYVNSPTQFNATISKSITTSLSIPSTIASSTTISTTAICQTGYVLGSDGLCHAQCGSGYCSSGAYCYNSQCVSCLSGYYLATDGYCYPNSGYSYTTIPYTTTINYYTTSASRGFQNGNFTFTFTLLNGSQDTWSFPLTTYNYYETLSRVAPIIRLNDSGKTIYTYDYRGLITPSFFAKVVPMLTNRKSAGQFVQEVINIKDQLTAYSLVFYNTSVYPAEVLSLGKGDCKDLGVLMASILEAGNMEASYGMQIQLEYVDAFNLTKPRTANHLILSVTFANGTSKYIDTTNVLPNTSIINVTGWRYTLICNATSCQTTLICNGAYCDAVGYSPNGSNTGYNYCSTSGYVTGADNLCHPQCGADWYCNSGYYCGSGNLCYS